MTESVTFEATVNDGTVTVIQHIDPDHPENDFEEDPELPVYSAPLEDANKFASTILEAVAPELNSSPAARLVFPFEDEDDGRYIANAETNLKRAGVRFDSGVAYDEPEKEWHWELDFSLEGARIEPAMGESTFYTGPGTDEDVDGGESA